VQTYHLKVAGGRDAAILNRDYFEDRPPRRAQAESVGRAVADFCNALKLALESLGDSGVFELTLEAWPATSPMATATYRCEVSQLHADWQAV
jgi:hypothetical protein